ncbi:hypothetical protein D9757_005527 [Collybiopsis confluens]|uniref:Nucleoside diphosphate kinase n=1 Tax=Collybiopsis confluens TaxID=2823264 RepID=A0A8H5M9I2_9AGAR|nr:hypothetical protein D9757_005527 [Collybiopsis confluens]
MAYFPPSKDTPYDLEHDSLEPQHRSATPPTPTPQPQPKITRTVAIIKTHALGHRFDIEPRIQEASFEASSHIVKERQMEFDVETDPDTLYELFGQDAESFAEGPVWVYVLERRRAVEVWNTLMGNEDPVVAQKESPHSLRALYGTSLQQNAVMGSSDAEMAELQIASLFASSPPFPTSDLPSDDGRFASVRSMSSSILSSLRRTTSDEGYAASNATNEGSRGSGSRISLAPNGKPLFKARDPPNAHKQPDIIPRTTRAASLRAGIAVERVPGPRKPLSKEEQAKTFANVPGHKRAETITVASTAAPVIAPRMTKAAALRLGVALPTPTLKKQPSNTGFDGVPGHKRRESIAVASTQAPTVKPRLNKSASLRATKDNAPPTSFMFRGPTQPKLPGKSGSQLSVHESGHNNKPSRPSSVASSQSPSSYAGRPPSVSRPSSAMRPLGPSRGNSTSSTTNNGHSTAITSGNAPSPSPAPDSMEKPKLKSRPSSVSLPPTIVPRTNKSAALRAAKKEQEAAAAAALAAKQQRRASRPPPSSMPKGLIV